MKYKITAILLLLFMITACRDYTPKPAGYNRIELPRTKTNKFLFNGFSFDYPDYIRIDTLGSPRKNELWFNIVYPQQGAVIHCTYFPITRSELKKVLDDSYNLAYSHVSKADGIDQKLYTDPENKVWATVYNIRGNVATPVQFFATDSVRNFLRGSFYYSDKVDADSVTPVTDRIREDIAGMINTLRWQ